jgi:hypothetical protein
MLCRNEVILAFRRAVSELGDRLPEGTRPRAIAHRAHEIYCAGLAPHRKKPSPETFRKFATGRLAIPEVARLLKSAHVQPAARAPLDRERLREVFREAIRSMESRLLQGRARPLQIVRRAYKIYVREDSRGELRPSHHTFERLIYGKRSDPEILDLIHAVLKKKDEGYLRGLQGLAWERPDPPTASQEDPASLFLRDVRRGAVPSRGRIKKTSNASVKTFLQGFYETFPEAREKPFAASLGRFWARWSEDRGGDSSQIGRRAGRILRQEYEEGIAGDLLPYVLDERLHLRPVRDYLLMRGWLQGTIECLRRRSDWESREQAGILGRNFSSIVLRALHNGRADYAQEAVLKLPRMIERLDHAIDGLAAAEPEAAHLLRSNRLTVFARALHSGYLDYPDEVAEELPKVLKDVNRRISRLEETSPEAARNLRADVPSAVYRALTNGTLETLARLK